MNFRQLHFSPSLSLSLSIFPSYSFTSISDSVDNTSQASTFIISNVSLILSRHSCLPFLLATFILLSPLSHSHFLGPRLRLPFRILMKTGEKQSHPKQGLVLSALILTPSYRLPFSAVPQQSSSQFP